ncbi:alcohol dehydrogenase catalytic domain-containing protein [Planosporangium thailandense]|uniref:Alcohol dehydrogenase catalytic domain-containing protein n=1 Tax=Planosporangium thailandense TaxID=765197 RepID=A0ABX0Y3F4_9ACTN|nr:alcohol dehydrogenase catalytic domain-containing protein [Planosporangium thailandense]NJC72611.1 alcohol dehydrogenase catalytic domain-containing protein [Planosporangium thailandense]
MTIHGRVLTAAGAPTVETPLELVEPDGDLVRVRLTASGVCHSDLHVANGEWSAPLPMVLGHEGAGVVEAVGPQVRTLRPGDHVALSWYAQCGHCRRCRSGRAWLCTGTRATSHELPDGRTSLRDAHGAPVHAFLGLGTFAEAAVVPEAAAVAVPDDVPARIAALIGCAVTTGVGAVLNTAQVRAGDSAVVVGCGGVGQSILLGLALAGAHPIIAVDLSDDRLAHARALGATHVLRGDDPDLVAHVAAITDDGADHAFEAIGRPETIEQLPSLVGRGGNAVLVGMPAEGVRASFDPFDLADAGKRVLGCNYGSSVPAVDFPRIAGLYRSGRLPLDALVGAVRPLAELDAAFGDLRDAVGLRTVLDLTK